VEVEAAVNRREETVVTLRRDALFSPCGSYRYRLTRRWAEAPTVAFIMLNPSTADGSVDDPTIRRCIGYAKTWGYGALAVGNLYAFRATEPEELRQARDAIGSDNDLHLECLAQSAARVVCAWGTGRPAHAARIETVIGLLRRCHAGLMALRLTKSGQPVHPLYQRADLVPVPFPAD
jgi:hypothetical protein